MCGRYVLKADMKELKPLYGALPDWTFEFTPINNVAPTFDMPVILQSTGNERIISLYWWGLVPYWAKELKTKCSMINARTETLTTRKTFQRPFQQQRCIVPASGFYERKPEKNQDHIDRISEAFETIGFPVDGEYPLSGILTELSEPKFASFHAVLDKLKLWEESMMQLSSKK